jgi:hypothetical protein
MTSTANLHLLYAHGLISDEQLAAVVAEKPEHAALKPIVGSRSTFERMVKSSFAKTFDQAPGASLFPPLLAAADSADTTISNVLLRAYEYAQATVSLANETVRIGRELIDIGGTPEDGTGNPPRVNGMLKIGIEGLSKQHSLRIRCGELAIQELAAEDSGFLTDGLNNYQEWGIELSADNNLAFERTLHHILVITIDGSDFRFHLLDDFV